MLVLRVCYIILLDEKTKIFQDGTGLTVALDLKTFRVKCSFCDRVQYYFDSHFERFTKVAGADTIIEMASWNKEDEETKETELQKENQDDYDTKEDHTQKLFKEDDETNTEIDCEEYGQNISNFMKQEYKAHDKVKGSFCNMCPNSFKKNSYLKQHIKRVHTLDRKLTRMCVKRRTCESHEMSQQTKGFYLR